MAVIRIIEDSAEALRLADRIREAYKNSYNVRDELLRIACRIESCGDVTLKEIQELQGVRDDYRAFAEEIEEILKGVGYE